MLQIGNYNTLRVVKLVSFGVYLDGGEGKEILLPTRYVPKGVKVDDEIQVFIYHDNEGRLIATTLRPKAVVGEFAFMRVKSVNDTGAFLDWGLMKDLLVPFKEQKMTMREGKWYLVYVHLDHLTGRIVASARIEKFLGNVPPVYQLNQEVDLLVADDTEIGYKVIVDNLHWGMIYHNQVFQRLERGEHLKGYVKEVREDDKLDISLQPLGYQKIDGISQRILNALQMKEGFLPVHDKSDPEEIYSLFRCSKKAFKQAIGSLYKQRLITIEKEGIRLLPISL
ncbi:GntR family transcriptional regulator [Parabacteroides sp. An277]|uniref:CvfB family protein n=1 Tax=Parabacteroides sp. An277 TaxID=1965619 RepID=UPI000B38C310|nr:S1-like domain-containing RNA-binding protein [Parabacteroides sp. An277]OUO51790.1 GntR family transcriptional regulator [Parabacteroides sp. An277]